MKQLSHIILIIIFNIFFFINDSVCAMETAINGFISQGYLKSDKINYLAESEEGSFQMNDMGLKFSARLPGRLWLGMQFYARDLGDLGNDEITLDWALADARFQEWIGLQVGKLKIPHGLYNESRDADMARTSIFLPSGVYNEAWREAFMGIRGVGLYGDLLNHFTYKLQIGELSFSADGGMAKSFDGGGFGTYTNMESDSAYAFSFECYDIIEGLKLKYSLLRSDTRSTLVMKPSKLLSFLSQETSATQTAVAHIWVLSIEYALNKIRFAAEYNIMDWDMPMDVILSESVTFPLPLSFENENFYVHLSYRFTEWFEIGYYYSVFYFDKDKKDRETLSGLFQWPDFNMWNKDSCLSLRFDLNDNWIVKLEGHYMDGTGTAFLQDNKNSDDSFDIHQYFTVFAAKISYSF